MVSKSRSIIGSGISTRTRVLKVYDADTDAPDLREYFRKRDEQQTRQWAGLTGTIADIRRRRLELLDQLPNERENPVEFARHNQPRESLYWYLNQIDYCSIAAEHEINEGRYWAAVEQGALIGELITEMHMKQLWEDHALRGQKALESVREGARVRRRRPDADRYADVAREIALGRKVTHAFAIVAKLEGAAVSTVSKSYYLEKGRLENKNS